MRLRDIAMEAGVSESTVSRVVNNKPARVGESTRQRILEIARSAQYRPNRHAVSLATGQPPGTLALVTFSPSAPFRSFCFSEISAGVVDAASACHLEMSVVMAQDDAGVPVSDLIAGHHAAGWILVGVESRPEVVDACLNAGLPAAVIGRCEPRPLLMTVDCDHESGARDATLHLIHRGHRRIGFVGGSLSSSDCRRRLVGYRQALEKARLQCDHDLEAVSDHTEEGGRVAMASLLSRGEPPSAVVCFNDSCAVGAMVAIREIGMTIPNDVAVVGFDDVPVSSFLDPPLSTVHQPLYEMGQKAAQMLLERIASGEDAASSAPAHCVLQPHLVMRRSSGAHVSESLLSGVAP